MLFFARCTPQRLRRVREEHGRAKQGREKVRYATFIWSLVVHALSGTGSLGHHLRAMSGTYISDAAAQQRRQGLSWAWFEALFASVLQPLAQRGKHPESFHGKMRLLGIDGTQWSLPNTQAHTATRQRPLAGTHRSEAAFLKWGCAVLLELGTHQPLGAACAQLDSEHEEGELTVARRLLGCIPQQEDTLLLADRYYGRGAFLEELRSVAGARCEFLVRVPSPHKARILEVLSDGSALVEVRVCHPNTQRTKALLRLREVRGLVWRQPADGEPASERAQVRLWTTLLDDRAHQAQELLALYARRWEQELFFRELKRHTGREHMLRSGSPQGVHAEYGAMIIAASLLAEQRLQAAEQVGLAPVRLSITKISRALEALLPVLEVAGDLIDPKQQKKIVARFLAHAAREARIPPRRPRGCQRGLRKPLCAWPRIHQRSDLDGTWTYAIKPISFP